MVTGPNVLAVEMHQNSPESSDVSFDLALVADVLRDRPRSSRNRGIRPAALGRTVTFSVVASGAALTYQWDFNGAILLDATNAILVLPNIDLDDAAATGCMSSTLW